MNINQPQTDYTAMTNGFQLVMPLDCEANIEKNAPVRLLNAVMERMDYSKLNAAYLLPHNPSAECATVPEPLF